MKKRISFNKEKTVYTNLIENEIYIEAPCGGNGICNKCWVEIDNKKILACKTYLDDIHEVKYDEKKYEKLDEGIETLLVDLGTTNIKIWGITQNKIVDKISIENPQKYFGADLVARLSFIQKDLNNLKILNKLVLEKILSFNLKKLKEIIFAGNSVMQKIITDSNVDELLKPPYLINEIKATYIKRENIDFVTFPYIQGFVGGDSVSILLNYIDNFDNINNSLIIDIGTNSELILIANNQIICGSAAAGPVFEGDIECGSNIKKGSLIRVNDLEDKLDFSTYKSEKLNSISGSGLISLISELIDLEIIKETGELINSSEIFPHLNKNLKDNRFYLNEEIYISQDDIRKVQLAKSAIKSGVEVLLREANINMQEIEDIIITGNFGNNISKKNLMKIGIIPRIDLERLKYVDNLVLKGLYKYCTDKNILKKFNLLLRPRIVYKNLSKSSGFKKKFIKNIDFSKFSLDK